MLTQGKLSEYQQTSKPQRKAPKQTCVEHFLPVPWAADASPGPWAGYPPGPASPPAVRSRPSTDGIWSLRGEAEGEARLLKSHGPQTLPQGPGPGTRRVPPALLLSDPVRRRTGSGASGVRPRVRHASSKAMGRRRFPRALGRVPAGSRQPSCCQIPSVDGRDLEPQGSDPVRRRTGSGATGEGPGTLGTP